MSTSWDAHGDAASSAPGQARLARKFGPPITRRTWDRSSERTSYFFMKRIIDVVFCALLIIAVAPMLLICAICIKLDSRGPVFFLQERTGLGGHRFKMFKLRTMVTNAEELKEGLREISQLSYPDFKLDNDPRMTRIGRFLRKTSLDEIPQLLNVLLGDMSLVGPRPTSFAASTYKVWHTARLRVLPGITGLWQVSGRSDIDFDDRARLDIAYIENRSLWLDIKILFRTVSAVVAMKGAS